MLPPFVRVVDYRRYRLDNTEPVPNGATLRHLYWLKTQIDGLYPTLGTYSGAKPISPLWFLTNLKEAFNSYGTSESVAVRAFTYFLAKDAKDVYQAQVNFGALDSRNAREATWPCVTNALIRPFLEDDNMQSAYDAVVRATQGASEDEVKFAQRIIDAARECCHVFQPMELVNSYVRGLHEATRERIQEQVRRLPPKERADLVTVRQVAAAEGRAQRPLLPPKSIRPGGVRAASARQTTRTPTFFMEPNVDSMPVPYLTPPMTPTTLTSFYDPGPAAHEDLSSEPVQETPNSPVADPVSIVEAAVRLDSIFLIGELTKETLEGYNLDGRIVLRPTGEIPDLTDEQVGQAMAVTPADYWQLNCWSCRSSGHSIFTCPKLSVKQRI